MLSRAGRDDGAALEGDKMTKQQSNRERGYTLLEYCAGAAIIGGILYLALNALGHDLRDFLAAVGAWAGRRAGELAQ